MKFLTVSFTFGLLMLPLQANACRGLAEEYTIFFNKNPRFDKKSVFNIIPQVPQSQAIIKIQIVSVKNNIRLAKILQVLNNKKLPVKVGSSIVLDYKETSCTQPVTIGEIGTIAIIGFVNSDDRKELKAYIYQRRYKDGRVQ